MRHHLSALFCEEASTLHCNDLGTNWLAQVGLCNPLSALNHNSTDSTPLTCSLYVLALLYTAKRVSKQDIEVLSTALQNCTNLTHLDLSGKCQNEHLVAAGWLHRTVPLLSLLQLTRSRGAGNALGDADIHSLCLALVHCKALVHLALSGECLRERSRDCSKQLAHLLL